MNGPSSATSTSTITCGSSGRSRPGASSTDPRSAKAAIETPHHRSRRPSADPRNAALACLVPSPRLAVMCLEICSPSPGIDLRPMAPDAPRGDLVPGSACPREEAGPWMADDIHRWPPSGNRVSHRFTPAAGAVAGQTPGLDGGGHHHLTPRRRLHVAESGWWFGRPSCTVGFPPIVATSLVVASGSNEEQFESLPCQGRGTTPLS